MNIALTETKDGDTTVLDVSGRVDSTTADEFNTVVMGLIEASPPSLVLDCAGLEFLSSAGIRVLMLAAKRTRPAGIRLALCALRDNIAEVFEISGITGVFAIHPDRAGALASLR